MPPNGLRYPLVGGCEIGSLYRKMLENHADSHTSTAPMMMANRWIELVEIDHFIREDEVLPPANALLGGG